ncbi:hypothetical protein ABIF50_005089 [Bradyrhizobium diazoefficiens]
MHSIVGRGVPHGWSECGATPPPQPSPTKGEGAERGSRLVTTLLAHCGAPSVFFMVVLASHSSFTVMLLRCMAT